MQSWPENGMINGVKDSKCVGNLLDSHTSRKARIQKANLKVQEAGHCKLAVLARHCRSQELRPFQASWVGSELNKTKRRCICILRILDNLQDGYQNSPNDSEFKQLLLLSSLAWLSNLTKVPSHFATILGFCTWRRLFLRLGRAVKIAKQKTRWYSTVLPACMSLSPGHNVASHSSSRKAFVRETAGCGSSKSKNVQAKATSWDPGTG